MENFYFLIFEILTFDIFVFSTLSVDCLKLRKMYKGNLPFIEEMKKRNIIGIDATIEHKDMYLAGMPPEGYIWEKPSDIKIKLVEIVKL